eukprot:SAG11_NODE_1208_length_5521_cov_4.088528_7_plen_143_part_00
MLLTKLAEQRPDAASMLQHPWLSGEGATIEPEPEPESLAPEPEPEPEPEPDGSVAELAAAKAALQALRGAQRERGMQLEALRRERARRRLMDEASVVQLVVRCVESWDTVEAASISVTSSAETEWHQVYFVSCASSALNLRS